MDAPSVNSLCHAETDDENNNNDDDDEEEEEENTIELRCFFSLYLQ
jgi:hypothetical protein